MKHNRSRIIAFVFAVILLFGVLPVTTFAATSHPQEVKLGKAPWGVSIARFPSGTLSTGNLHWYNKANPNGEPGEPIIGNIVPVYCMDLLLVSEHGMSATTMPNPLDRFNAYTQRGLQIILENGFHVGADGSARNVPPGMDWKEAYAATESAIRWWLGHCGAANSQPDAYYAQQMAVAGHETAFDWRTWLYNEALEKAGTAMLYGVTLSPMTFTEVGDHYVATVQVDKHDLDDWRVINNNLPAGSSISPTSGTTNGTITISVPARADTASKNYAIHVNGTTQRHPSNFGWYVPADPKCQDFITLVADIANANDEIAQATTPAEPVMGRVTVEKTGEVLTGATEIVGEDYTQLVPRYEVRGLLGAVFDIIARKDIITPDGTVRAAAGTVVDTIPTTADGKAESKLLHLGDYYAVERTAPFGMVLNDREHDFSLTYEDQTTAIVVAQIGAYNTRQKVKVTLSKDCEVPDDAPEGYNPYVGITFGLFAREDVLAFDGTVAIPAGRCIEYVSVDNAGTAEVLTDLPRGSYYVKELFAHKGYSLNETEYDFIFTNAGQMVAVVEIAANDGAPIENKLQRGSLKIIKVFEERETPIAGVPFTITGITTVGTTVTIEAKTDENGEILLEDLLIGEYTVTELASDLTVGYVLALEETTTVAHEQIAEMTIHNRLIRGRVQLVKRDAVTGQTLEGAEFSLFSPDGGLVGKYVTDENGIIVVEDLPYGIGYMWVETRAPAGFLLDIAEITFDIAEDGVTVELAAVNGKIPHVPDNPNTGDSFNGVLWLSMLGAATAVLVLHRRKKVTR